MSKQKWTSKENQALGKGFAAMFASETRSDVVMVVAVRGGATEIFAAGTSPGASEVCQRLIKAITEGVDGAIQHQNTQTMTEFSKEWLAGRRDGPGVYRDVKPEAASKAGDN